MIKWLNPLNVCRAFWAYTKKHFVAWNLSSVWTWGQAFLLALAYPNWAYATVHEYWPVVKTVASDFAGVTWSFLNTS